MLVEASYGFGIWRSPSFWGLNLSKAQQSCVPATAPRAQVAKQQIHKPQQYAKQSNKLQNRLQNASKTRFGAVLGGSKCSQIGVWRGAVRVLGASWAILASEVQPGRRLRPVLWAIWGHHWAVLGRLWGAPGGVLRRLGVYLA